MQTQEILENAQNWRPMPGVRRDWRESVAGAWVRPGHIQASTGTHDRLGRGHNRAYSLQTNKKTPTAAWGPPDG